MILEITVLYMHYAAAILSYSQHEAEGAITSSIFIKLAPDHTCMHVYRKLSLLLIVLRNG